MNDTPGQSQTQNGEQAAGGQQSDKSGGTQTQNQSGQQQQPDLNSFYKGAYNDGLTKGQERVLKDLGFDSLEAAKAAIEKSTKKPEITPEQLNQLPAFVELQKKTATLEAQATAAETRLREITVTNHITALAKQAGAADPDYALYRFMQGHKVELDANGKAVVKLLDGTPVQKLNAQNQIVQPSLDEAFAEWFGKQPTLKAAPQTAGAGALGNKGGSGPFTREQIAAMSTEEFKKNEAAIFAQMRK